MRSGARAGRRGNSWLRGLPRRLTGRIKFCRYADADGENGGRADGGFVLHGVVLVGCAVTGGRYVAQLASSCATTSSVRTSVRNGATGTPSGAESLAVGGDDGRIAALNGVHAVGLVERQVAGLQLRRPQAQPGAWCTCAVPDKTALLRARNATNQLRNRGHYQTRSPNAPLIQTVTMTVRAQNPCRDDSGPSGSVSDGAGRTIEPSAGRSRPALSATYAPHTPQARTMRACGLAWNLSHSAI